MAFAGLVFTAQLGRVQSHTNDNFYLLREFFQVRVRAAHEADRFPFWFIRHVCSIPVLGYYVKSYRTLVQLHSDSQDSESHARNGVWPY